MFPSGVDVSAHVAACWSWAWARRVVNLHIMLLNIFQSLKSSSRTIFILHGRSDAQHENGEHQMSCTATATASAKLKSRSAFPGAIEEPATLLRR